MMPSLIAAGTRPVGTEAKLSTAPPYMTAMSWTKCHTEQRTYQYQ